MKKLLSLLLAVLMAFSVVTFTASATEADEPTTGETEVTPETPSETPTETPTECAHKWAATIIIDATCTKEGVRIRECELCGKEEPAEYFGPFAHKYEEEVKVEATCADKGYAGKKCTACGDIDIESETPALPHTYGKWEQKLAPTCTEAGLNEKVCSTCNGVEKEVVPALGHDYKEEVIEPDYENGGYTIIKCKRCDYNAKKEGSETDKLKGKVVSLELGDKIVLNYEDTVKIDMSGLVVGGDVDYTVSYEIKHRLPEEKVIELVDAKEGTIKAVGMGNATLKVTVTDEYGNVVDDSVTVQVNFSILDWFELIFSILKAAIEIVLGGLDFSSLGQLFK